MTAMPWREGWEGEPARAPAFPWFNPFFWLALWASAYYLTLTYHGHR